MKLYWFVVAALLCLWPATHLSLPFAVKNTKSVLPNYETVTFSVSEAYDTYDQFLQDLRRRLTGGSYANIPILRDPSTVTTAQRFILVALKAYSDETITLAVDVTNVYVVGYLAKSNTFWYFTDAPQPQTGQLFPGSTKKSLGFGSSYTEIQQKAGLNRDEIPLSFSWLSTAITNLYYTDTRSAQGLKTAGKSLLITVQAIAEATRFQYIADRVSEGVQGADTQIQSYETSWAALSKSVQAGNGVNLNPPLQLKDEQGRLYTVSLVSELIGRLSLMNFVKKFPGILLPFTTIFLVLVAVLLRHFHLAWKKNVPIKTE